MLWFIFLGAATSIYSHPEEFSLATGHRVTDESVITQHVDTLMGLFFSSAEQG